MVGNICIKKQIDHPQSYLELIFYLPIDLYKNPFANFGLCWLYSFMCFFNLNTTCWAASHVIQISKAIWLFTGCKIFRCGCAPQHNHPPLSCLPSLAFRDNTAKNISAYGSPSAPLITSQNRNGSGSHTHYHMVVVTICGSISISYSGQRLKYLSCSTARTSVSQHRWAMWAQGLECPPSALLAFQTLDPKGSLVALGKGDRGQDGV